MFIIGLDRIPGRSVRLHEYDLCDFTVISGDRVAYKKWRISGCQ